MSYEELKNKTTIEFERPVDLEETKKLLNYLVEHMPANIRHTVKYSEYLLHCKKGISEDKGALEVMATLHSFKTHSVDTFKSIPYSEDSSLIASVAFQTMPGEELLDYKPETLEFWDQTKELVNKYFKEFPKKIE